MWIATDSMQTQTLVGGAGEGDADAFDVRMRRGTRIEVTPGAGEARLIWRVASIADGGWHHIAVVRDAAADTVTLYVDAISQGTKAATLDSLQVSSLGVGADQTGVGAYSARRSWNGSVDEVRIYHRVLTVEEIAELAAG